MQLAQLFQVLSWSEIVHILLPCDLVQIDVLHCIPYTAAKSHSEILESHGDTFPEPELPVAERCSHGSQLSLDSFTLSPHYRYEPLLIAIYIFEHSYCTVGTLLRSHQCTIE